MTEIHTEELLDRLAAEALPDEPAPLGALVAAAEAGCRDRHHRRRSGRRKRVVALARHRPC